MKVGSPATPPRTQALALEVDRDAVPGEIAIGERGDALGTGLAALHREHAPSVMLDREGDVGPRHRQPLHDIEAGAIFGARRAQELAARRHAGEQLLDAHARAGRQRGRALGDQLAIVDGARPAVGTAQPALDRQPRDAGDRRQRFAAKTQRRDGFDRIVGQFGGGVTLERERHIGRIHAAAVVDDLDQFGAAGGKPDGDPGRARIDSVFNQFLQRAGRAFDHLTGCNSVDKMLGETAY